MTRYLRGITPKLLKYSYRHLELVCPICGRTERAYWRDDNSGKEVEIQYACVGDVNQSMLVKVLSVLKEAPVKFTTAQRLMIETVVKHGNGEAHEIEKNRLSQLRSLEPNPVERLRESLEQMRRYSTRAVGAGGVGGAGGGGGAGGVGGGGPGAASSISDAGGGGGGAATSGQVRAGLETIIDQFASRMAESAMGSFTESFFRHSGISFRGIPVVEAQVPTVQEQEVNFVFIDNVGYDLSRPLTVNPQIYEQLTQLVSPQDLRNVRVDRPMPRNLLRAGRNR